MEFLQIVYMEKEKGGYMSVFHPFEPSYIFHFLQKSNKDRNHNISLSKQRLHKLCFLHKLGCQKPCWDQTRLSSLVNKQVDLVHFASNIVLTNTLF